MRTSSAGDVTQSTRVGRAGLRAEYLRKEADKLWSEVDRIGREIADLHDELFATQSEIEDFTRLATEAEHDDPDEDAAWADRHAARSDRRQIVMAL